MLVSVLNIAIGMVLLPAALQKGEVRLPPIARVFGIEVGRTTREELEARWGRGWAHTGGHPRGARAWHLRNVGVVVRADGFDYALGGMLLDGIWIQRETRAGPHVPSIRIRERVAALWGGSIRWGMGREQVIDVLKAKQWRWSEEGTTVVLTQMGSLDFRGIASDVSRHFTIWEARLGFKNGLDSVWIQAG